MDEQFYLGLANELAAKLRRVGSFVQHGPSIGTYHEEALRSVLRSMLSNRFQLRTGFVYTRQGGASKQCDIMLVDEDHPNAYYFRDGDFAIVSPEAVACVVEVKTTLSRKTFVEALSALHSVARSGATRTPPTLLFAYESAPFSQRNLRSWYEAVTDIPDEIKNYPWAIYALNQGLIILQAPKNGEWGHAPIEGDLSRGPKLKYLSMFLQTLRKATILHCRLDIDVFDNALMDGLRYADYFCRYGSSTVPDA